MQDAAADWSGLLAFWGKSSKEDPSEYHPAVNHLADVACVAKLLWRECLSDALRGSVEADIVADGQTVEMVVAHLAGLHDLGKVSPAFQRLRRDLAAQLQEAGLELGSENGVPTPHGIITARELAMMLRDSQAGVRASQMVSGILAKIAGAHHGVFPQAAEIKDLGPERLGDSKWADARSRLAAHLWLMLNNGEETSVELAVDDLANPTTVPVLAGLISVADWIGSNTDYFPLDSRAEPVAYFQKSAQMAEEALAKIGWLPLPAYADPVLFEKLFPFPSGPNEMQRMVAELAGRQTEPFLLAIEAQMGQGKTEAALYAADRSLCTGQSRGLYVALPTQATSNAMFDRVRNDYLEDRGHTGIEDNMQLVHGNALLGEIARVSRISEDDSGADSTVSARSWFTARKRPLLAPFGVGTIDQALLGVLQTRHWFVRLFGLANKVVIFDEVHAYDTYTSKLLDHLIKWLSTLECTVVLLSATLPKRRLSELVKAYGGTNLAEIANYPRITLTSRDGQPSCVHVAEGGKPKPVLLEFESDDPPRVAQLVSSRLSDGGCAAVICNTVDRAQRVFEAIEDEMPDCDLILFHARTPFLWRKETEEDVLRKFGKPDKEKKSPDRPHKAVVVATQVIEQSLDLDFDWILTDMAPVDLILQRLGREHRHKRPPRPAAVSSPILTILSDGDVGGSPPKFENAGIYERYVLLRSWLAIIGLPHIRLPHDIDCLVQWVYGDEEPQELDSEWVEALEEWRDKMRKRAKKAQEDAEGRLVPHPTAPARLIRHLSAELDEDDDPATDASLRALTRDGRPSIRVVCLNRDGDRLYPMCGAREVDLQAEPDTSLTQELLDSSLSIQNFRLYEALKKQGAEQGWKKSPHLRYHRTVEFVDGATGRYPHPLGVSRELGLVIKKEEP